MLLPNWPLPNQSINQQSIINQSSANQPSSIPARNSSPPVVDAATELATAQSINPSAISHQQSVSH
eukprot:5158086-Prymnesium_polylepis.1